jgi:VWFA-related protein
MPELSRKTALALIVLILAAGASTAQEPSSPAREVLLDVLVTSPKGEPIAGLGPEDFTVQEDGKPVEVTGVTFHTERHFLLLFEIPKGKPKTSGQHLEAAQRTRKWLQQELRPDDWVAVMSHRGRLELHQDFTRDREALSRAVGEAMAGEKKGDLPASPAGSPSLKVPRDLGARTRTISESLGVLGEAVRSIPARKSLVLFTDGLDKGSTNDAVQALNSAHVSVYPVDLADSDSAGRQPLRALAEATGGRFIEHFWSALDQVSADNAGYYMVRFQTSRSAGEVGDIRVSTTRPDAVVRARTR